MRIAVTGATGFLGRYIVQQLLAEGHTCRCWWRKQSASGARSEHPAIEWIEGDLRNRASHAELVSGCDALVHAALYRVLGLGTFRGSEGDLSTFAEINLLGSLRLFETALEAENCRIVFVSTCAVHEQILEDRPLDENHPTTPLTHYGAHKAALEQFVQSFGGSGHAICGLRPTGIYGLNTPPENSKWFPLVEKITRGEPVTCEKGGKEVHAADVAKAISILLTAPKISGQIYNCCDRYISEFDVAQMAAEIAGSTSSVSGKSKQPRHTIETQKIQKIGMRFGGETLLRETIRQMVDVIVKQ
ncbi:MAG: NAD(P)-dependent oxidoreductase [Pirellulales bacterium]|nr:NAD(P)-dependent oxidoreductase [Pirellulales bacterium]